MNTKRLVTTLSLLFTALVITTYAQSTKTVTVVQKGNSKVVTVDSISTINNIDKNVITLLLNDENMDSLMQATSRSFDKMVKIVTVVSDSLQKSTKAFSYAFISDDDFGDVPGESEMEAIADMDMNMVVHIDTLEGGKIVKKVMITSGDEVPDSERTEKRIMVMSDDDDGIVQSGENIVVMSADDNDGKLVWNAKSSSEPKKALTTVAVSDLHILKNAGFSTKSLTSEPLELKALNVDVERKKTSDSDIMSLSLDITLPENDKTTVTLISSGSAAKEVKSFDGSDKISVKFEMKKESAPYYVVVLQDRRVWTRKIEF